MKIKDVRKDGFYTDGTSIYFKSKGGDLVKFCKDREGIHTAYFYKDVEVEKVTDGVFYDGNLKVIDNKTIEMNACTYNYFWKQFADMEEAEAYAEENGVEVFDTKEFEEFIKVEFKKNTYAVETVDYKEISK